MTKTIGEVQRTRMTEYTVAPWVALVVVVLSVWRASHGPYSTEWWSATTQWLRHLAGGKR